ncbi:MAG: NAD-dependent epimerase/dehydratase family protein [Phycisphaerales bacterium JB050]
MAFPDPLPENVRAVYRGRTVCVTGGAGFIGGHLAERLLDCGASVQIIDDLSNSDAGLVASLVERYPGRARFVYGSILDPTALAEAVENCSIVFHLAAMGSVPQSIEDPERCAAVNITGSVRVAQAAKAAGAERWVYSASASAYGGTDDESPRRETESPVALSPYAASKLAGEQLAKAWSASMGLDGVSLRYFNIFGSRQAADSAYAAVVAAFYKALSANQAPTIYGDGTQTRDFTHVDNAVWANMLAGAHDKPLKGAIINIGCGQAVTLLELLDQIAASCDRDKPEPTFAPARTGDIHHSRADISLARTLIGYEPVTTLEEGLAETAEWFGCTGSRRI